MLKKCIGVSVLLFGCIIGLHAAYQYNVDETGVNVNRYQNKYYEGYWGNYFSGDIVSGSNNKLYSFYVTDKINNLYSMSGNNKILSKVLSDFGYVDKNGNNVSWTGNTVISNQVKMNEFSDVVTQTAYEIGQFNPSEEIKLWMKNSYGDISYSDTPIWFKNQGGYGISGYDAFETKLAKTSFLFGDSVFYGLAQSEYDGPTGQPLPGALATMLIGSGVLGLMTRFRKKKTA